ncbi:hypothetical protein B0A48_18644 [Cryoendolithus antarcticus]|uniref:Uncharacterized protein n=1 Tax=Cryoendolithus antarcticus TaxID=1507870 RepID=A0A1V8S8N6_9PEZI|nr:hypothetical protein B0A48_18644 [Cryoendolithus antarcticus]
MKSLIKHVDDGGRLDSQADVPQMIRQQLYAEQHERSQRRYKKSTGTAGGLPPITINNMLPSATRSSPDTRSDLTTTQSTLQKSYHLDFELPGFRDVALNEYSEWHESRVFNATLKADFVKARDIALANALDLELIHEENDPSFFGEQGVKRGTAKRFVGDIGVWAKKDESEKADSMLVNS